MIVDHDQGGVSIPEGLPIQEVVQAFSAEDKDRNRIIAEDVKRICNEVSGFSKSVQEHHKFFIL